MAYDSLEYARLVALVWACDAVRLSAVVGVGADNDAEDGVLVGLGILETLENDRTYGVRPAVAIGLIVEGVAVS